MKRIAAALFSVLVLAGCGSQQADEPTQPTWADSDVSFEADGLTIHGSGLGPYES